MRIILAVMALSLALMAGCGGSGDDKTGSSAKPPKSDVNTEVSDGQMEEFSYDLAVEACVEAAVEEGAPSDMAEDYCDCAIERIVDEVGEDGLVRLGWSLMGDEADLDGPEMEAVEEIIIDCSSEVLEASD